MSIEHFDRFNTKYYQNGSTNKIIKCIKDNNYSSIYGRHIINSDLNQIFTWTFRIHQNTGNAIYIGISTSEVLDEDCFANKTSSSYGCASGGNKWVKGTRSKYHELQFNNNDIITMRLDFNKRNLSFTRNSNDLGILNWTPIDIGQQFKYKLALIMAKQGDQIELIDFKVAQSTQVKFCLHSSH